MNSHCVASCWDVKEGQSDLVAIDFRTKERMKKKNKVKKKENGYLFIFNFRK